MTVDEIMKNTEINDVKKYSVYSILGTGGPFDDFNLTWNAFLLLKVRFALNCELTPRCMATRATIAYTNLE